MSVIDILPGCISSVYFMWEKEYEKLSLGKVSLRGASKNTISELVTVLQLSALREISLAKEFHDAGVPQLRHLYMGQDVAEKPFLDFES